MACFKTRYFAENKVKVHMFAVPVCGLVDWAFVVLCEQYIIIIEQYIKENNHSL